MSKVLHLTFYMLLFRIDDIELRLLVQRNNSDEFRGKDCADVQGAVTKLVNCYCQNTLLADNKGVLGCYSNEVIKECKQVKTLDLTKDDKFKLSFKCKSIKMVMVQYWNYVNGVGRWSYTSQLRNILKPVKGFIKFDYDLHQLNIRGLLLKVSLKCKKKKMCIMVKTKGFREYPINSNDFKFPTLTTSSSETTKSPPTSSSRTTNSPSTTSLQTIKLQTMTKLPTTTTIRKKTTTIPITNLTSPNNKVFVKKTKDGDNAAAIAGIIIAAVFSLALTAIIIFIVIKRRRKMKNAPTKENHRNNHSSVLNENNYAVPEITNKYDKLENTYAQLASPKDSSPQIVLDELKNEYKELSPKEQCESDVYTELQAACDPVYNELELYSSANY